MKQILTLLLPVVIIGFSCQPTSNKISIGQWKNEIIEAERAFSQMATDKGIAEAFLFFADEYAVLERDDVLIKGRQSILDLFEKNSSSTMKVELSWEPDFVDVSTSGDLGYTYGKYQYASTDSLGNRHESEGIFHTVWKRQEDGSWKYVWD